MNEYATTDEKSTEPEETDTVDEDAVRVATTDGGIVEAKDDAEILDETDADGCAECAGLPDGVPCWECFRDGATFGGDE